MAGTPVKSFWRRLLRLGPSIDDVIEAHVLKMAAIREARAGFERNVKETAEQVYRDFRYGPFWSMMGDAPFRPADGQGGHVIRDGSEYRRINGSDAAA